MTISSGGAGQPRPTDMRVLYVNHTSQLGGAEQSLQALLRGLDRRLIEPMVVLPGPGPLAEQIGELGITVEFIPMKRVKRTRNPLRMLSYVFGLLSASDRLGEVISQSPISLVHANTNLAAMYVHAAARRSGTPFIWHVRDLLSPSSLWTKLYREAAQVVAISHAVAQSLQLLGDPGKVRVIYNGIDAEAVSPARVSGEEVRRELGLRKGDLLVGTVGQLVPWKRHDLFLKASAEIAQAIPHARFVAAGSDLFGDHPRYARALPAYAQRLELGDRVRFLGQRTDALEVIAALDLLLHPAEREPFGRVLIEAMALGKPVVAVNAAGPKEIVENGVTGLLVPPDDAQALAEAAVSVLSDRQRAARMGQAGRELVLREFPISKTISAIQDLYREVCGENA